MKKPPILPSDNRTAQRNLYNFALINTQNNKETSIQPNENNYYLANNNAL